MYIAIVASLAGFHAKSKATSEVLHVLNVVSRLFTHLSADRLVLSELAKTTDVSRADWNGLRRLLNRSMRP